MKKGKWYGHVSKEVHLRYAISDKGRISRQKTRDKFRDFIFQILGDKCCKCGNSDRRVLQMDHKNGRNGMEKLGNIDNRYRFVRDNISSAKSVYQILCANCNWIKRAENKEYNYNGRHII